MSAAQTADEAQGAAELAWGAGGWHKGIQGDADGSLSQGSGGTTHCPAATSDDGDVSGKGSGSGSGAAAGAPIEDAWSRDDDASSGGTPGGGKEGDGDPRDALPSLRKDGAVANAGSAGHPTDCKPCAFYCYSLRGCRNGTECCYCHLYHESKLRQRREDWKRAQREKRGRQRDRRAQRGEAEGSAGESPSAAPAPAAAPPPLVLRSPTSGPHPPGAVVSSAVGAPAGELQAKQADAVSAVPSRLYTKAAAAGLASGRTAAAAVPAPAATPQARSPAGFPEPGPAASPPTPSASPGGAPGRSKRESPATSGSPLLKPHSQEALPRSVGMVTSRAPAEYSAPMRVPQPRPPTATSDACLAAATSAASGTMPPMDFFAYTPNSAVISIGQMVEMWPPVQLITAGLVFAVSPELPRGLALDERSGLIHGRPQEGTAGLATHFVTACKPGDTSMRVKLSMVNMKVVHPQTAGLTTTGFGRAHTAFVAPEGLLQDSSKHTFHSKPFLGSSQPYNLGLMVQWALEEDSVAVPRRAPP